MDVNGRWYTDDTGNLTAYRTCQMIAQSSMTSGNRDIRWLNKNAQCISHIGIKEIKMVAITYVYSN